MPNYKDLQLTLQDTTTSFVFNDITINVKQYLPLDRKTEVISAIINRSNDDQGFYNSAKLSFNVDMELMKAYTDIEFDEGTDAKEVYDALASNGFFEQLYDVIPKSEIGFILENVERTINNIYEYRNSVYGILDTMKTDYSDLDFDVEKLRQDLADGNNVEFLKEVLEKMG